MYFCLAKGEWRGRNRCSRNTGDRFPFLSFFFFYSLCNTSNTIRGIGVFFYQNHWQHLEEGEGDLANTKRVLNRSFEGKFSVACKKIFKKTTEEFWKCVAITLGQVSVFSIRFFLQKICIFFFHLQLSERNNNNIS